MAPKLEGPPPLPQPALSAHLEYHRDAVVPRPTPGGLIAVVLFTQLPRMIGFAVLAAALQVAHEISMPVAVILLANIVLPAAYLVALLVRLLRFASGRRVFELVPYFDYAIVVALISVYLISLLAPESGACMLVLIAAGLAAATAAIQWFAEDLCD